MADNVSPVAVEKHLKGIDYPASKQDLIQHAQGQDAPEEVIDLLNQMPEKEYDSPADVSKGVGTVE